jgi:hypothetical protein
MANSAVHITRPSAADLYRRESGRNPVETNDYGSAAHAGGDRRLAIDIDGEAIAVCYFGGCNRGSFCDAQKASH